MESVGILNGEFWIVLGLESIVGLSDLLPVTRSVSEGDVVSLFASSMACSVLKSLDAAVFTLGVGFA